MCFGILKNVIFFAYFYTLYALLSPKAAALAYETEKGNRCAVCLAVALFVWTGLSESLISRCVRRCGAGRGRG